MRKKNKYPSVNLGKCTYAGCMKVRLPQVHLSLLDVIHDIYQKLLVLTGQCFHAYMAQPCKLFLAMDSSPEEGFKLTESADIIFCSAADMQFMSNYTSAAASRQPNGETRWKKRKREEKNRRICGCRISYEPAPITWGPTILCRWTPKPTKRRRNNNHKREINWRRSVLWRTAGFVTTWLSLWRVELEKGESNNDGVTVVSRHASGGPCEL